MKKILLVVNHGYLMFGVTVYVGVLWALHFFWYPSWAVMTIDSVQDHFINPTSAATDFFWIVVPLMFLTNGILIWREWHSKQRWTAIFALLCLIAASYVGQQLIIPINKEIATGTVGAEQLAAMLKNWMFYNDIRWVLMSLMWLTMMRYFFSKGALLDVIDK
ncbi:hypothetical protein [Neptunicella sp. SCSIO 80796]|uniref:hypothetical protein n=1 Tax=Neptunicella plasticusilytica TaxID=3117012 RepID=UPI003A4D5912